MVQRCHHQEKQDFSCFDNDLANDDGRDNINMSALEADINPSDLDSNVNDDLGGKTSP